MMEENFDSFKLVLEAITMIGEREETSNKSCKSYKIVSPMRSSLYNDNSIERHS